MQVEDEKHELITLSAKGIDVVNESRTNVFWVDYFPWLSYIPSWIPGSYRNLIKYARKHAPTVRAMKTQGFDIAIRDFVGISSDICALCADIVRLDER